MKILVSDPVSEQGVALLREHFEVDVITKLPPEEQARIRKLLYNQRARPVPA